MSVYQLVSENVDFMNKFETISVGRVQTVLVIKNLKGTVAIRSLDVYPLKYHPDEKGSRESLVTRGIGLVGMHHKQYNGVAATKVIDKVVKHHVRATICLSCMLLKSFQPGEGKDHA